MLRPVDWGVKGVTCQRLGPLLLAVPCNLRATGDVNVAVTQMACNRAGSGIGVSFFFPYAGCKILRV